MVELACGCLRLYEDLWDSADPIAVIMQRGYHPALRFQLGSQKAKRAELVPMAPEFAELLEATREGERHGRVFPIPQSARPCGCLDVGHRSQGRRGGR